MMGEMRSTVSTAGRWLTIALFPLVLLGCDDGGDTCTVSSDCDAGSLCIGGACTPMRRMDSGAASDAGRAESDSGTIDVDGGPAADGSMSEGDGGVPIDAGPVCDDSLWPSGLRRIDRDYEEYFGAPFGESTHLSNLVEFDVSSFVAIGGFTMPEEPLRRRLVFVMTPTSHNQPDRDNPPTLTVSECPGDFTGSAVCTMTVTQSATLLMSTRPEDSELEHYCRLEPGRTYYLNFVASRTPFDAPPSCSDLPAYDSSRCALLFSEAAL